MADYNSSLPVRTQNNGDVVSFIADGTVNTQLLRVNSDGSINVDQNSTPWNTKDAADGPVAPGTIAGNSILIGGQYSSPLPTLTAGQQSAIQVDSSGRLLVTATLPYDTNYGTVGANTLRTAAQIGNATGAASFNFGSVTAQTLQTAAQVGNATGAADFNYGTAGAQTLRSAAQIGNSTGQADFNAGSTGAQTLRTSANQGTPASNANAWPILITAGGNANSATNPVFVTLSDVVGTPVDNYQTSAALAAGASVTLTYTVTTGKTFYSKQFWVSGSGKIKAVVQYAGTTFWVGFNSTAETNILIPVTTGKTAASATTVSVTITNEDKAAFDVYSTISGVEQ